jgi:GR25 family glycosyltransferase involved in LPS biosynthesis
MVGLRIYMDGFVFNCNNTFCISLEYATSRRERMKKRFDYFGLDVSFCSAVLPSEVKNPCVGYLNDGQRACSQSHFNIWQHISKNKIPYALILEDDATFDIAWREKLNILYQKIGLHDWDAIFLNCSEPIVPKDSWNIIREQYLTGAYIISLEGVGQIFHIIKTWFSGELHSSDWTTNRLQLNGKSWGFFPWLVIQEGQDSNIGSDADADHKKVVRCLNEIGYDISVNYI